MVQYQINYFSMKNIFFQKHKEWKKNIKELFPNEKFNNGLT